MSNENTTATKSVDESLLSNPDFKRLLERRARLRWSLSGILIAAYVTWALAGIYAPDVLGARFMASSLSWGIVIGYAIIALSIACAIVYIQIINRLHLTFTLTRQEHE